jgi:hypothetical protein
MAPRYWWQDRDDDEDGEVLTEPPGAPPASRPCAPTPAERLRAYRAELIRRAALYTPRNGRRIEIEARLVEVTAELLRMELGLPPHPAAARPTSPARGEV